MNYTDYKADSLELTKEVRDKADGEFIDLPLGFTRYKCEGEGTNWAVLVHGYATPLYIYDKLAEGLVQAGYRVLRYDLIGRGLSERIKAKYDPALFVRQLEEITGAIVGDEPFYLFGTSMGGTITTSFTAKHPDKVKKLVLLAPAGMRYKYPFYMKLCKIKGIGELMFNTVGGKILTKGCASEMIYSGDKVADEYRLKFAQCIQYKGMVKATLSSMRYTLLNFKESEKGYEGTGKTKVPVLVVWGTADKTMPYYQSERMKQFLPQMKLVSYENSGHIFVYDEGKRTVETVLPFLAE